MKAQKAGKEIKITDCYMYRESIKEIVGRRYNSEEKAWYIPLTDKNIGLLQMLGAELDDEFKKGVNISAAQDNKRKLANGMPIRAAPYAHQIEAFNFAMEILTGGQADDD